MGTSKLAILEVAMKNTDPTLYDIYFSGQNLVLHYQIPPSDLFPDPPFIVVGVKDELSKEAAIEFGNHCKRFKEFHKKIFGTEVKSFITTEEKFNQVDDWWEFFHPNGLYR